MTTTKRPGTRKPSDSSGTNRPRAASRATAMLVAALLALALAAVPASADPPDRFEVPAPGFVFPDFGVGYWFFVDVNRDAVCGGPDPFQGTALFQRIETSDAVVSQGAASAKTWLHAFVGEPGPDFNPCDNSAQAAALRGVVNLRSINNDVANEGNRANALGFWAQGELDELDGAGAATGSRYHVSWTTHVVIPPDENAGPDFMFDPAWIRADRVTLQPIGASPTP